MKLTLHFPLKMDIHMLQAPSHAHVKPCSWVVLPQTHHMRVCLRRPGAKGFEDAERGLWRMRLPPGAESSARDLDPSRDPNPASSRPNTAAPCLCDRGADSAPARTAASGGSAGAGNPGVNPARAPGFNNTAQREGEVVGYWHAHSTLTHVVIRNAGHMVPHDRPLVAQARTRLLCHYLCLSARGDPQHRAHGAAQSAPRRAGAHPSTVSLLCASALAVIRNAGHMVPHDRPLVAQARTRLPCHYSVPTSYCCFSYRACWCHSSMRTSNIGTVGLDCAEGVHWHKVIYELGNQPLLVSSALCRPSLQCPGCHL